MFLIPRMVDSQPMVGALQVLDAYFKLLVNTETGVVHLAQRYSLFRQVLGKTIYISYIGLWTLIIVNR